MVVVALAVTQASMAVAIEDAVWHEVRSTHFVAYSSANVNKTSKFLKLMELLHELIPGLTTIELGESPIPTEIVFVDSKAQLRLLGVMPTGGGEFIESLRSNLVIVRDSRRSQIHEKVLYLYAKFLLNNSSATNAPRWVREGFAQYLRSMHLVDGGKRVKTGSLPKFFGVNHCGWPSIRPILEDDLSTCAQGQVHIPTFVQWLLDQDNAIPRLQIYLSNLNAGKPGAEAFSEAFDISVDQLNIDVLEYKKNLLAHTKSIPVNRLLPDFETTLRVMSADEVVLVLARTALRTREFANARYWLNQLDWSSERTAMEVATLGALNFGEGKLVQAGIDFAQAEALDSHNELILLDTAKLWLRHAYDADNDTERSAHAREARRYIAKAWKLNDQNPETYALYGRSYLLEDKLEESLDTLEATIRLLPSHNGVLFDLSQAYRRLHRYDEAERAVRGMLKLTHIDRYELSDMFAVRGQSAGDSQILRRPDNHSLLMAPRKPGSDSRTMVFWY